jgi:GDPmannose 4,6-dehydratase
VDLLIGDPRKAHQKLGWRHETSVRDLCREMVNEDLKVMQTATVMKDA